MKRHLMNVPRQSKCDPINKALLPRYPYPQVTSNIFDDYLGTCISVLFGHIISNLGKSILDNLVLIRKTFNKTLPNIMGEWSLACALSERRN